MKQTDVQRTKGDQKSSLELSAQVGKNSLLSTTTHHQGNNNLHVPGIAVIPCSDDDR